MTRKNTPLAPDQVRHLPTSGWSWIDRRFTREWLPFLSRDATLLYFFLAAVSDRNGLSYYADGTIATRLHSDVATIVEARTDLVADGLLAYRVPLYQVLRLPPTPSARHGSKESDRPAKSPSRESFQSLRDILGGLKG